MKYYVIWSYGPYYERKEECDTYDTLQQAIDRYNELVQLYGRHDHLSLRLIHGELLKDID